MSLVDLLKSGRQWEEYHDYKVTNGNISSAEEKDLFAFVSGREYISAVERVFGCERIAPPERKKIGKTGTNKKRIVYVFPREENFVFKLLTYLLMRKYDDVFCSNLYSFRAGNGVINAVNTILRVPGLNEKYTYIC